jgi:uncharacterized OsmC-like protein
MTTATHSSAQATRKPVPLHGVDTPTLLATIDAVGNQPELAKFTFRAKNEWVAGTHSRTTMSDFFGAGAEHRHSKPYDAEGDHPKVLCGADNAPTPVEWVLHALASCLTAGIANIAAARGIKLNSVTSIVEGNIDLRGILGLSKDVRNGYQGICLSLEIDGDGTDEELEKIVVQSKARSAVFDMLSQGVPISLAINA